MSNLEETFGQDLETKLEKLGFKVTLPTDTDWGYVFRVKFRRHEFDVIITIDETSKGAVAIKIESTLSKLEKFLGFKDFDEHKALSNIINELQ